MKFYLRDKVERLDEIGEVINMTLGGKYVKIKWPNGEEWLDVDKLRRPYIKGYGGA